MHFFHVVAEKFSVFKSFATHWKTARESPVSLGMHEKFGEGVVLDMEGQGAQTRLQVSFDFDGTKWLVSAYANLRPMDD